MRITKKKRKREKGEEEIEEINKSIATKRGGGRLEEGGRR